MIFHPLRGLLQEPLESEEPGGRVAAYDRSKLRNRNALPAERIARRRGLAVRGEPVPRVDTGELVGRERGNRPAGAGRTLEHVVVMHNDDAVARKVNVELEAVRSEGEAVIERRDRVFRPQRRAVSVIAG